MQIEQMILGERQAPWEDPEAQRALLRPLGIFGKDVLKLLARDPTKRSTIHSFHHGCRHHVDITSTKS